MGVDAKKALGPEPTCPPPDPNPRRPRLKLPPLSCDSHFHIFGPASVFPYAEDRAFTPYDAPKEAMFALHRFLGFERGLIVQSSCHGADNSAMLDGLAAGDGAYRGVALLEPTVSAKEVERLNSAGVCGVRFHFVPHLAAPPPFDELRAIMRLVAPYDWHIAVHTMGQGLVTYLDFIRSIEATVIVDHIGRTDVSEGADGATFTVLRRLLDKGNVWVKLSGIDRVTREGPPRYRDAVALARVLARQTPERILWGTDWPHPNVHGAMPNDGDLVDAIAEIATDEATRRRMLVDNPAEVFRFG